MLEMFFLHAGKTATAIARCPVDNSKLQTQALQWQLGIRSTRGPLVHALSDMQCTLDQQCRPVCL